MPELWGRRADVVSVLLKKIRLYGLSQTKFHCKNSLKKNMQELWSSWHLQMQEKHIFVFVSSCEKTRWKTVASHGEKPPVEIGPPNVLVAKKGIQECTTVVYEGPIAHLVSYWRSFVCQKAKSSVSEPWWNWNICLNKKCRWKHHAPANFSWSFIGCLGKKRLTCKWKKNSNKLHLKDLLYEFIILLNQFEPGSPPIAKCRQRRLPTFMVALLTARNDIWKSKKSNLFGGKKKSGANLESFLTTCHLNGISKERQPHKMPLWYHPRFFWMPQICPL